VLHLVGGNTQDLLSGEAAGLDSREIRNHKRRFFLAA
jgi:hypothetical protein